jgi:hypothetical protein
MTSGVIHDEACLQAFAEYEHKKSEYESRWPNYCRNCNGDGGFYSTYDPSPAGVSLGSGFMVDFDTCPSALTRASARGAVRKSRRKGDRTVPGLWVEPQ